MVDVQLLRVKKRWRTEAYMEEKEEVAEGGGRNGGGGGGDGVIISKVARSCRYAAPCTVTPSLHLLLPL